MNNNSGYVISCFPVGIGFTVCVGVFVSFAIVLSLFFKYCPSLLLCQTQPWFSNIRVKNDCGKWQHYNRAGTRTARRWVWNLKLRGEQSFRAKDVFSQQKWRTRKEGMNRQVSWVSFVGGEHNDSWFTRPPRIQSKSISHIFIIFNI